MSGDGGGWRFGRFELDAGAGTLRRDGRKVRLQPQPLRVLAILIEHAGQMVGREELQRRVWDQATFVEFDQGLNYCIRQIRLALGDDPEKPRFIETVRRKGYQFIAPVERIDPPATATNATAAPPVETTNGASPLPESPRPPVHSRWPPQFIVVAATLAVIISALAMRLLMSPALAPLTFTQTTNFTDAAFSPALSPDGRMVAFLVGSDASFPPTGEVFTRTLPNGEPVQRTHDGFPKYGVTFSPDGLQITYTVADATRGWITEALDVGGGAPRLLVPNAAGLTWVDPGHVLFGEIKHGLHMGLVAATVARSDARDVYVPAHERAMAHVGVASPDRANVLVVEMGPTGGWERCRLVPYGGGAPGTPVGPNGACTAALWSPDGAWMYFTASVNGSSHVWRQRFPRGAPEQLTFGPGEENGLAFSGDGRSLITSAGMQESGVWWHTATGDRLISPEGYARSLSFSADGTSLYFVMKRTATSPAELWMTDMQSRVSTPVVQGHAVIFYDVSGDGREVVFSERDADGRSGLWLASRDGRSVPRRLSSSGEDQPFFLSNGDIVFRASDNGRNFLSAMKHDGSARWKVRPDPIVEIKGLSPDRQRVVIMIPVDEVPSTAVVAMAFDGGATDRICPAECMVRWSPGGRHLYVEPLLQGTDAGDTAAIPVPDNAALPRLPQTGLRLAADARVVDGTEIIDLSAYDPAHLGNIAPGVTPGTFAFTKTISHRNLFQIQLAN